MNLIKDEESELQEYGFLSEPSKKHNSGIIALRLRLNSGLSYTLYYAYLVGIECENSQYLMLDFQNGWSVSIEGFNLEKLYEAVSDRIVTLIKEDDTTKNQKELGLPAGNGSRAVVSKITVKNPNAKRR